MEESLSTLNQLRSRIAIREPVQKKKEEEEERRKKRRKKRETSSQPRIAFVDAEWGPSRLYTADPVLLCPSQGLQREWYSSDQISSSLRR